MEDADQKRIKISDMETAIGLMNHPTELNIVPVAQNNFQSWKQTVIAQLSAQMTGAAEAGSHLKISTPAPN